MTGTWWIALHTLFLVLVVISVLKQPQLLQGVLQSHRHSGSLMLLVAVGMTLVGGFWAGVMVDRWPLEVWKAEMAVLPRATGCGPLAYTLVWRECRDINQRRDATMAGYAEHDRQALEQQLRSLYPGMEHQACVGSDCIEAKAPLTESQVQAFVKQYTDFVKKDGTYERAFHQREFVPEIGKALYAHFDHESPMGKTLRLINFSIVMGLAILATVLVLAFALSFAIFLGLWCLLLGGGAWLYHWALDAV